MLKVSHKQIYKCLINMINWTTQHQKTLLDAGFNIPTKSWAKEMSTIKFCLPRQSGHTTFAIKLFTEYFDNAILILPNDGLKSHRSVKYLNNKYKSLICTPGSLKKLYGRQISTAIIDCASIISNKDKEKIYSFFEPIVSENRYFLFIFLE